jgi:hypothetical protein
VKHKTILEGLPIEGKNVLEGFIYQIKEKRLLVTKNCYQLDLLKTSECIVPSINWTIYGIVAAKVIAVTTTLATIRAAIAIITGVSAVSAVTTAILHFAVIFLDYVDGSAITVVVIIFFTLIF